MSEHDNDAEEARPVAPLRRQDALLTGLIACNDCGEKLVSVVDANGVGWYVHEADAPPAEESR